MFLVEARHHVTEKKYCKFTTTHSIITAMYCFYVNHKTTRTTKATKLVKTFHITTETDQINMAAHLKLSK